MVDLFENLQKIRPEKEKVSPVGPFLSMAAQNTEVRGRASEIRYYNFL
jgi:hypothetical protein